MSQGGSKSPTSSIQGALGTGGRNLLLFTQGGVCQQRGSCRITPPRFTYTQPRGFNPRIPRIPLRGKQRRRSPGSELKGSLEFKTLVLEVVEEPDPVLGGKQLTAPLRSDVT